MPTKNKRPTQVWAVEYTSIEQQRCIAVMDSADDARIWIDMLERNVGNADPVLLCSEARFSPVERGRQESRLAR